MSSAATRRGGGAAKKWLSTLAASPSLSPPSPHALGPPQISSLPPVFILAPPPPSLLPQRTLLDVIIWFSSYPCAASCVTDGKQGGRGGSQNQHWRQVQVSSPPPSPHAEVSGQTGGQNVSKSSRGLFSPAQTGKIHLREQHGSPTGRSKCGSKIFFFVCVF